MTRLKILIENIFHLMGYPVVLRKRLDDCFVGANLDYDRTL